MKNSLRDTLVLLSSSGLIVALDQWTKWLVRTNISLGGSWTPWEWLEPYARIVNWYNAGSAFGLLQGWGPVIAVLAVIVSGVIIYYYPRIPSGEWMMRLALVLQLAGAVGNLIDRLTIGHVTDFISVGTFPVFNVADSSITVGVAVLLLATWIKERRDKKAAESADQAQETARRRDS